MSYSAVSAGAQHNTNIPKREGNRSLRSHSCPFFFSSNHFQMCYVSVKELRFWLNPLIFICGRQNIIPNDKVFNNNKRDVCMHFSMELLIIIWESDFGFAASKPIIV